MVLKFASAITNKSGNSGKTQNKALSIQATAIYSVNLTGSEVTCKLFHHLPSSPKWIILITICACKLQL